MTNGNGNGSNGHRMFSANGITVSPPSAAALPPEIAAESETVSVAGESLTVFPRGRHDARRQRARTTCICIPLHNGAKNLPRALRSLTMQRDRDFDVIVVDNASTDDSFVLACRIAAAQDNVTVYRNPRDIGRVENWNRCLDLASGDLVKLLMANDFLDQEHVARMAALMKADPSLAVARCAVALLNPDGQMNVQTYFPDSRSMTGSGAFLHGLLADKLAAGPSSHIFRRPLIEAQRLRYDVRLPWAADFLLAMRLYAHGDFAFEKAPLVGFDAGADRLFTSSDVTSRFDDECSARLLAARNWPHSLSTDVLVLLGRKLGQLFDAFRAEAKDATAGIELAKRYAQAARTLADLIDERAARMLAGAQPVDINALIKDAETQTGQGQLDAAERTLRVVLSVAPWHAEGLNDMGVLRYQQGQLVAARRYFEAALDADGAYVQAKDNLTALAEATPQRPLVAQAF